MGSSRQRPCSSLEGRWTQLAVEESEVNGELTFSLVGKLPVSHDLLCVLGAAPKLVARVPPHSHGTSEENNGLVLRKMN